MSLGPFTPTLSLPPQGGGVPFFPASFRAVFHRIFDNINDPLTSAYRQGGVRGHLTPCSQSADLAIGLYRVTILPNLSTIFSNDFLNARQQG